MKTKHTEKNRLWVNKPVEHEKFEHTWALPLLFLFMVFVFVWGGFFNSSGELCFGESARAQTSGTKSIADISEEVVSSVVNISSERVAKVNKRISPFFQDPFFRHFFGDRFGPNQMPRERREKSLGSGVVVTKDGVILTNNHVIQGADNIRVTFSDGREMDAKIVGSDPKSDVAVLRVEEKVTNLVPLKVGDSSKLRLGEVVLAVGNPFGVGQTVTMGIVSAKGRANVGILDYEDFIQTDAAINPGNSGGALVNMSGELVGINTAILSRSGGYQGIGFAIPSNMVKSIMDSLISNGKVQRGWLGVMIQDVDKNLASALNLKRAEGVLIGDVIDDGPADKAKVQRGDVILKVDGRRIRNTGELRNVVAQKKPNSKVDVLFLRDGKKSKVTVMLGELPSSPEELAVSEDKLGILDGIQMANLNSATRERFRLPKSLKSGAVVVGVVPGSDAEQSGLIPGDVILKVNRQSVKNVSQFRKFYNQSRGQLLMLVHRKNHTIFIVLEKR